MATALPEDYVTWQDAVKKMKKRDGHELERNQLEPPPRQDRYGLRYGEQETEEIQPKEHVGSTPGFEKVQRFLRQQRATGRVVSPEEGRTAWQAYWDSWMGKQTEREKTGLAKEAFEWQKMMDQARLDLSEEQMENAEDAARGGGFLDMLGLGVMAGGIFGGFFSDKRLKKDIEYL